MAYAQMDIKAGSHVAYAQMDMTASALTSTLPAAADMG